MWPSKLKAVVIEIPELQSSIGRLDHPIICRPLEGVALEAYAVQTSPTLELETARDQLCSRLRDQH